MVNYLQERNFERVYPASLPLSQQISLFSGAKTIISMAGAAFTNLIHSHPKTPIIIFYPKGLVGSQYLWLGKAVGLENIYHVILENSPENRQHTLISLKQLQKYEALLT